MSYLSGMLHSLQPLHFFTCCQYVKKLLRYDHFNTCQLIYTPKWAGAIGWLGNVSMLECNRWSKEEGEWIGSSSCCVTSVWWHGTKLRARLALTAAFAHSNASCRPGPRPLSCCQHTDRLSWIISYLPNLSLQRRASFGGCFKPHCYGSQAPSLFYGYFGPSLTTALSFLIHILLYLFLDRTVLLSAAYTISVIPSLFASES